MTIKELQKIGFKKKVIKYFCEVLQKQKTKTIYEIKGKANDFIYYNPEEKIYKFYYKTAIGTTSNHIHLDIDKAPELIIVLQIFQFNFNNISLIKTYYN